jgi:putative flippase GtrA
MLRNRIINLIDWFYPPFKRLMPLQTFRYAACGGSNMILDISIFYISLHYILHQNVLDFGFNIGSWHAAIQSYTAALLMAFCVTFPLGFILSKYIVFNSSYLKGRVQLFRYMIIVAINLVLNYTLMKILVEYFGFYPTIARIFSIAFIVTFSFLSQKHFTFQQTPKVRKSPEI